MFLSINTIIHYFKQFLAKFGETLKSQTLIELSINADQARINEQGGAIADNYGGVTAWIFFKGYKSA